MRRGRAKSLRLAWRGKAASMVLWVGLKEEKGEEGKGEVTNEEGVEMERAIIERKGSWMGFEEKKRTMRNEGSLVRKWLRWR